MFYQFTTANLIVEIDGINASNYETIDKMYFTIVDKSEKKVLEKPKDEISINVDGAKVSFIIPLSQQETALMGGQMMMDCTILFNSGERITTDKVGFMVKVPFKQEVIE